MFRNSGQRGMVTIFYSCGAKPLAYWDTHIKNGYIQRFLDPEIKSTVFEICGNNVSTTYMVCPKGKTVLGLNMPFLVMVVKNLKKYFSFEVTILDEDGQRRRFRASNFQSTTSIHPMCTAMPIGLSDGWNQIQFNLAEFTRRAYQKQFIEVQKLKVNANICLRRIYFADRLLPEDQLPLEYKLYIPLASKGKPKKLTEPTKTEEVIEERKSSKDVTKPESKHSVLSKTKSEQKAPEIKSTHQIAPPADASDEVSPEKMQTCPRKSKGEQNEAAVEIGGAKLPEGDEKGSIEAVGEETATEGGAVSPVEGEPAPAVEGEAVPPVEGEEISPLELPGETEPPRIGQDVEESIDPSETPASMLESGLTPITEVDVNVTPETAPGTETHPPTELLSEMDPQTEQPSEMEPPVMEETV